VTGPGGPVGEPASEPPSTSRWAQLVLAPDGTITAIDDVALAWTGRTADDLVGVAPFSSLLTAGGRIYHETHFAPLLHLQGSVHEVAFDLRRSDGSTIAVLAHAVLHRDDAGEADRIEVSLLDATIRRSYERELLRARRDAELAERQVRSIAEALQRSLLQRPDLPTDLVSVETRYRPAVDELEVGGDWHDAFPVDAATIGISVGDVVGKGIDAACAMGQVRSALRALARTGCGPASVLAELDRFVKTVPDAYASTAIYAEVGLGSLQLSYAAAGHPPPIVARADGSTELVWGGRSTPIGAPPPRGARAEGTVALQRGDRVLLYTDGLCERQDRLPDDGFALVAERLAATRTLPLAEAADELIGARLTYDALPDDTCLLLLEVRPPDGA